MATILKKNNIGGFTPPLFKTYKSYGIQDSMVLISGWAHRSIEQKIVCVCVCVY